MGVFAYPPEKVYSKGERADCVLLIEGLMCNPFYFNLLEYKGLCLSPSINKTALWYFPWKRTKLQKRILSLKSLPVRILIKMPIFTANTQRANKTHEIG